MEESEISNLQGMRNVQKLASMPKTKRASLVRESIELGLPPADSVNDPEVSTFVRGGKPVFAGIQTFCKSPYLEEVRKVGDYDIAIIGVPYDTGASIKSGSRLGPQAIRRASCVWDGASIDIGVDMMEFVQMVDLGDVFVIPGAPEKSFDQITKAVSFVVEQGVFPVMFGGDHSIAFPDIRGVAKYIEGNVGVIHVDRHLDLLKSDMGETLHTCPLYHATNLPNVSGKNLVQVGIGGFYGYRDGSPSGVDVSVERGVTTITMGDVDRLGIDKVAEIALEIAWKGCKAVYLSFDLDSMDASFAPGTGSSEPGGFYSREALRLVHLVAKEGLCGMDIVEVAPQYDVGDITSLMAGRVALDALGTLVVSGHLPKKT